MQAFVLVLHERPDLDGVAAAYLAIAYLTTGQFPPGAKDLADYVDRANEGSLGISQANFYSLKAALHSWPRNCCAATGTATTNVGRNMSVAVWT